MGTSTIIPKPRRVRSIGYGNGTLGQRRSTRQQDLPQYYYYYDDDEKDYYRIKGVRIIKRRIFLQRLLHVLFFCVFGALCGYIYISYKLPATKAPSPELHRKGFAFYRILGNDLPPRHKPGQTLNNVRFILENEVQFPNTEKWWIVNRIVDPEQEAAILKLLESHNQKYIRIPFEEAEYIKRDFRYEDFPIQDFFRSDEFSSLGNMGKLRVIDYTYHDKNLYVMNNNGGRNYALTHGKQSNAKWILPFDGNCFFTESSFNEIVRRLERYGDSHKYFIVPMARVLNNTELLENPQVKPVASQEPQIIFRYDSTETFNMQMRYGRRPKLELLWRLGAYKSRDTITQEVVPWEVRERPDSSEKGGYETAGWVFRLFSGQANQEINTKEATRMRAYNRLLAIQQFIDAIDEKIVRKFFSPDTLLVYNETKLRQERFSYWSGEPGTHSVISTLQNEANEMVDAMITHFRSNVSLLEEVNLASGSHPAKRVVVNLQELFHNVTTLTLASYFTGEEKYYTWAANVVRRWILGQSRLWTYKISEFQEGQDYDDSMSKVWEQFSNPITPLWERLESIPENTDFSYILDAFRLLQRANALNHKEYSQLVSLANRYLIRLISSTEAKNTTRHADHRGTFRDLQVTSLSAFVNDVRLFLHTVNWSRMRVGKQFGLGSNQPFELDYVVQFQKSEKNQNPNMAAALYRYHSTQNLYYWSLLARIVQNAYISNNLWEHSTKDGRRLSGAIVNHLTQHLDPTTGRIHRITNGEDFDPRTSELEDIDEKLIWSLTHIAQSAHYTSDARRNIAHGSHDDHDYLDRFIKVTPSIYNREHLIRRNAQNISEIAPPYWMLGVA
ncbi:hypothetical protein K493DRAFT_273377 [Basidiobolus meristosporus CBS 931.73]|uniref:Alginate lyase domain-containing protein n=1 Tax=Basidiobolus meristosporus CBS 931.73 TaxID=1314790 RepID=A0A1Y1ZBU7_9FUNG|nr:hypothetical protein K493DRAFT_273377 [Basidiobolus meristosporus CBS 931.73]|eukprot:ORY07594.1 hypothetical protein K493DRAFT_273377 [Basidiobolus meristosporus CBS 931.73]